MSQSFIEYTQRDSDVPDEIRGTAAFEVRIRFFASGILGIYEDWFCNEAPDELNDLSLEVARIIKESSAGFLTER